MNSADASISPSFEFMRTWPQDFKQSLRLLAAARFFLPETLTSPSALEEQYKVHLRHADFAAALALLEQIGDMHSGYEEEVQFWKELYFAALHLQLAEPTAKYAARIQEIMAMRRL